MIVIAEVGLQHCGCLGTAHAFIDALAYTGVSGVKFQAHNGDPQSKFRIGTYFPQDADRASYWRRTAFTQSQFKELYEHARQRSLLFGVSCFSLEAVEMLKPIRPEFFKVGSAQCSDTAMLDALNETGVPVVLSTGMSSMDEIAAAAGRLQKLKAVCQCVSKYPCQPEDVGLNVMDQLRERFNCLVGLSDHSGQIWPGVIAAYLGAELLEVHVCWHKEQWGPDVSSALPVDRLNELTSGIDFAKRMRPVDKDESAAGMAEMRKLFREATNAK